MWLTRLAITRPVVIWMALVAITVLGLVSYSRLPAELNPQVDIPTITVITVYPGAGPPEIESLVTKQLEDAVGSVAGVRDVYSSSQESMSIISMDFRIGTDVDRALANVREKVDAARMLLPAEARAPIVAKLDINAQPVLYLALSSETQFGRLRQIVDTQVRPRIARIPGVASVTVAGGRQREIDVSVDSRKLAQVGITMDDVVNSVKGANRDVPGGSIVQGNRDTSVRTMGSYERVPDIASTQILSQQLMASSFMPDLPIPGMPRKSNVPAPVTLADVATVTDTLAEPTTLTRVNGNDSVGIVITKTSDANAVDVARKVKAEVEQIRSNILPDTQIAYSRDESIVIGDALEDVNVTLILGALLAMAVVYLFLHNLRGTIIVAMALPFCMVATFMVMGFAGFTLNQMTLLALSLSVGILIDDSIVVLESITRHLGNGEEPEEAAFNGRTEIGFAGVTLTLTDVVVFLPIAFMGGIIGAFFRQFGLTVVAATLFSLVVSFTVTPSLAARWYRRGENPEQASGSFASIVRAYAKVEAWYGRMLLWALGRRGWVVAFAVCALVVTILFTTPSLMFELLPATDQGQVVVTLEMPPDASLAATDRVTREVERRIGAMPDVSNYVATVGEILGGFGSIPQQGSQYAQVSVRLLDKPDTLRALISPGSQAGLQLRHRSDQEFAADLRKRLADVAGPRIVVSPLRSVADIGAPIQIQLRGESLSALGSAAAQVRSRLQAIPGILDPDVSLRSGKPEVRMRIDRARAAALDVPPALAGSILRSAIEGNTETSYREGGTEYPIRIRLAGIDRNDPADLANVSVGYQHGRAVTMGQVADLYYGSGPAGIDRVNGRRMVTVTANLISGYALGNVEAEIRQQIADVAGQGIDVHFGGESEAMNENIPYFVLALGLAVLLVYLVMASLFNNLLNPFIIMFTLPMALVGALAALAITRESFSLVAMIGVIMLIGLMGRNAIMLVDYTSTLRDRGMERDEAVAAAGATRLRPILMTTLATIFGMVPVALRIGRASELRAPMAIVVIGGLLVSSVLTLIVIPVLYTLFDDLHARLSRKA